MVGLGYVVLFIVRIKPFLWEEVGQISLMKKNTLIFN